MLGRWLIDAVGWRWAYVILGCLVWTMMFPILAIAFRNRPEDLGQLPDGDRAAASGTEDRGGRAAAGPADLDLAGAIRTRAYWVMFFAQSVWAMIGTALVFNIQKVFLDRGLSVASADSTLGWMFVCIAAMQLVGGLLADRTGLNWLLAAAVGGMASGVGLLLLGDATWLATGYLVFGLAQGLMGSAAGTLWARYFGRTHVGKIRGCVTTAVIAGSSLGPFLMGLSFDSFGSYAPSLWLFLGLYAPLAVASLFATPPQLKRHARPELSAAV
jgi:MFS family permease